MRQFQSSQVEAAEMANFCKHHFNVHPNRFAAGLTSSLELIGFEKKKSFLFFPFFPFFAPRIPEV